MKKIFEKKYSWAISLTLILSLATVYTLLDAFVIPKSYVAMAQDIVDTEDTTDTTERNETNTTETSSIKEAVIDENSYEDENISIKIETVTENDLVYYVADVEISDVSYLKTALANNTFGKNITATTSEMAEENNAIFAVNGDYYGFRDVGLIIRNGILYRDIARSAPDNEALTIDSEGNLALVTEGNISGESLVESGILQSFSFGPVLVEDGEVADISTNVSEKSNPRTAIGQISNLHYIFVVVDGRSDDSDGMTLKELAQVFVDRGASIAYNLDGGGSSSMWFNGELVNNPTTGRKRSSGERSISDIIYIGTNN